MCTAVAYRQGGICFGRTLDLEYSLEEQIVVTPRAFPLHFRNGTVMQRHYAVMGVACVREGYPLYYDAVNEKGLWMAGLNFPISGVYHEETAGKDNVPSYELILWVLSRCAGVGEAEELLKQTQVVRADFSPELPATPLHWMIADSTRSIVAEPMADGLQVFDNPVGVLTNEPPFQAQITHLKNYVNLSAEEPDSRFAAGLEWKPCSRGTGAVGLPGDLSSSSRFVRAAFTAWNSVSGAESCVNQCFHILETVSQCMGCCRLGEGTYERTVYTVCCDGRRGIYYYTTYENRQITAVEMHRENLEGTEPVVYPMIRTQQIALQNG